MICKECGAYNPDHVNFCKVCGADLRLQKKEAVSKESAEDVEPVASEPEEEVSEPIREDEFPTTRFSKKAVLKKSVEEPEEDEDDEEEEEDINTRRSSGKSRRRIVEEEDDDEEYEEDEDEEEDDDDEDEEEDRPARKPVFARRSSRKSREAEDDDDEDEEDDDEDEYDDDDEEEYEATPPSKKKKSSGGRSALPVILIAAIALILIIIICIIIFCNTKPEYKEVLPSFLQFDGCGSTEKEAPVETAAPAAPAQPEYGQPSVTEEPFVEPEIIVPETDYEALDMSEGVDENGQDAVFLNFYLQPGESATLILPAYENQVIPNNGDTILNPTISVPKVCYNPNAPLTESEYTATPEMIVTHLDGTKETKEFDSFVMIFPEVSLSIDDPQSIPDEGVMVKSDNTLPIHGFTTDHNIQVMANDQQLNVYSGGEIKDDFLFEGEEAEMLTITASAPNMVTKSLSFLVQPYVFIPEKMTLTVDGSLTEHGSKNSEKATLTGTVVPGSDVAAFCEGEGVDAGDVIVNDDGTYSVTFTFKSSVYGMFKVNLAASKDGYEDGEATTYIYRMMTPDKNFRKLFAKNMSPYYEIYKDKAFAELLSDPAQAGGFRFAGKVVSSSTNEDGLEIVEVLVESARKQTDTMYFVNMHGDFNPSKNVNKKYTFYSTLNGLYEETGKLFATCWYALKQG